MSKYRNRNIRNKFHLTSVSRKQDADVTADSGIDVKTRPFGDSVEMYERRVNPRERLIQSASSFGSTDLDLLEDEVKNGDGSFDRSSTSSLSWAEEYEVQATELVRQEYERMDRVLQRIEPIPPQYDKGEYKLWIRTFPCLSLTELISSKRKPTKICDKTTSSRKLVNSATVIDKLLDELYPTKRPINTTINPNTLNYHVDSFLQISSFKETKPPRDSPKTRHNKFTGSHKYNETSKYTSNHIPTVKSIETPRPPGRRRSDFIVLPPIGGRSISARSDETGVTRKMNVNDIFGSREEPVYEEDDHFRLSTIRDQETKKRFRRFELLKTKM